MLEVYRKGMEKERRKEMWGKRGRKEGRKKESFMCTLVRPEFLN